MKRFIETAFLRWKERTDRKPLVLLGARQVGKTWMMREFGKRHFRRVHEFNFDGNDLLSDLFLATKRPKDLLPKLASVSGERIDVEKDLIVFDEVQECYEAFNALKYFKEDCPQQAIVAAGSLLGVKIGKRRKEREQPKSFPVGMVDLMNVEPLSFGEFLQARDAALFDYWQAVSGTEPLLTIQHQRLLDSYDEYLIVGGMPECVSLYLKTGDVAAVREAQRNLLELYENDVVKHNGDVDAGRILTVWRALVPQLAKENGKFIYGAAKEGARAREYEAAVEWLVTARLLRRVNNLSEMRYPIKAYSVRNAFKLYSLDVGLLREAAGVLPKSITLNEAFAFKGRLAENFVLQQLAGVAEVPVHYWAERAEKEIDFVLQHGSDVVPVEVKAGEDKSATTFKHYVTERKPRFAIRFSRRNLRQDGGFVNIPLYLSERYQACLPSLPPTTP